MKFGFGQVNLVSLFDGSQKSFKIPVYQRAYSWEEGQLNDFLNDLLEQVKGGNHYFYGNILLEEIKKKDAKIEYEIIDGQ